MASAERRALAMAAAALLPGLLPTPPRSTTIIIPPAASNPKLPEPGRADSAERWDAHKDRPRSPAASSCSSTSPGRADSCQRWDMNKKKQSPVIISSSSTSSCSMSISGGSNERPARDAVISDAESRTGDQAQAAQQMSEEEETMMMEMEETAKAPCCCVDHAVFFSGPSFFVTSPEPSMLPMPAFLLPRRAGKNPLPSFVQLHLH